VPESEPMFMAMPDGTYKETTKDELRKMWKNGKRALLRDLEHCIDKDEPFLLITSVNGKIEIGSLQLTTSINSSEIEKAIYTMLSPMPALRSFDVLANVQVMMILRIVDHAVEQKMASMASAIRKMSG
jgi:hypothetical protein